MQTGLFTKIIAQSGAALDEWSIDFQPKFNALGIAEAAGCDVLKPDAEIVTCLQDVDALNLTKAYKDIWKVFCRFAFLLEQIVDISIYISCIAISD